jgi:hypothetical protein
LKRKSRVNRFSFGNPAVPVSRVKIKNQSKGNFHLLAFFLKKVILHIILKDLSHGASKTPGLPVGSQA